MQQLQQTTPKYKIYQVVQFCTNFEKKWIKIMQSEPERTDYEEFKSKFQEITNLYSELKNHTNDIDYLIDLITEKTIELELKYPLKFFQTIGWSKPKLIDLEGKIVGKS